MGFTVTAIWVELATLAPETVTDIDDRGLPGVGTLTVLTGQPVAADIACVMKPVPVMVMEFDWFAIHTLGEIEVMVGMEQTDTGSEANEMAH